MSTPIKPNQSLDDFINSTRMELLGDTVPLPKTKPPVATGNFTTHVPPKVEEVEENEEEGFFGRHVTKPNIDPPSRDIAIPDWIKSLGGNPLQAGIGMGIDATQSPKSDKDPISIKTPGMSVLAPGGAGLASTAGRAGIIRKTLATRMKGQKLVEVLPKIQDDIAAMGDEIYDVGANLWSASLSGMNPGQFKRFLAAIPAEKLPAFRAGMLEGLVENLANMSRLSKTAQQNLKSPAGRAMLREALSELTEDQFAKFMSLVDRGQYQRFRDMAIMVSAVYPTWRFIGAPIVKFFTGN